MDAPDSGAPRSDGAPHQCNGFDYLRLLLALGVAAFHSYTLSTGSIAGMAWQAQTAARLLLPAFFALSGYLVSGSVMRAPSLRVFLGLRLLRLGPGLLVVIVASVFVLGPVLGKLPVRDYVTEPGTWHYLANLAGQPQFFLPGLFMGNLRSGVVNGSLWTIPLEMECYLALALIAFLLQGRARMGALAPPGNHIPLNPAHQVRAGGDLTVLPGLTMGGDFIFTGSQFYDGDEANQNRKLASYWLVNLRASYNLTRRWQLFGLINNVFDRHDASYATYFEPDDTAGLFANPLTDPRSITLIQPISGELGIRMAL